MTKKRTYEELEQRVKELEEESFERKRTEETLKHQKRRLDSLIEYSSLAIVTLDEGPLLSKIGFLFGQHPEQLCDRTPWLNHRGLSASPILWL
ncbi:MAG: hypothetical protein JRJ69_08330 [Deltaproteobacteria bacterium]|nr:hypothetical protein [Deltaproteobacteria bacterium]MBW1910916.1 hypothetical protein [Deltaproteobacteria bacterium]